MPLKSRGLFGGIFMECEVKCYFVFFAKANKPRIGPMAK
jgi:hypothetical protein